MSASAIIFIISTLVTVGVTFLVVRRMANQLKQVALTERRISSFFLDLPSIICKHNRLYPQSEPMLAFWLSLIFLLVWLTCLVFSLAAHL